MNAVGKNWLLLSVLLLVGCAPGTEVVKKIWGSSTQTLERARMNAASQSFAIPYDEGFKEILQIAATQKWEIFLKDKQEGVIVVMDIPGAVDTTEVGIFVDADGADKIKVDITSLSSNAKLVAADILFPELAKVIKSP